MGGGDREYVGVYLGKRNSENREGILISVGHTAVASITLSFSFRFPARLSHVDSGE